ncbi:hypothetical protein ACH5RR_018108 [Cinchona calisaya]|uniref:RNase H type-1 domain-containing protein n=1 Tax=Cinchona calisaya TaxID=153742 RepID=A0ABD2ZKH2_9GENT
MEQWIDTITNASSPLFIQPKLHWEFLIFGVIMIEQIWFERNRVVHENKRSDIEALTKKINSLTNEHLAAQKRKLIKACAISNELEWISHPNDWVKAIVDATFKEGLTTVAAILRNNHGCIMHGHTKILRSYDANSAEAAVILEAMRIADQGLKKVILEGDSTTVISTLKNECLQFDWSCAVDIQEARKYSRKWPKWRFRKVPRNCNSTAHQNAKWAFVRKWVDCISSNFV